MPRLTGSGWAVAIGGAFLAVVAVALRYQEIGVLAAALLAMVAASFALSLGGVRFAVERQIDPERVERGDVALGLVQVTNQSRRAAHGLVARDLVGSEEVVVRLPRVGGRSSRVTTYGLPSQRRGVVPVGPLLLERSGPFGLARGRSVTGDRRTLVVHPRSHPLLALPSGRERSLDGPTVDSAPNGSITFHALREYVVGDDLRHVHWRTTARTGTMMVRQHVDTSQTATTIVVDCRAGVLDEDAFEEAMEVAASIVRASVGLRFPTRMIPTSGHEVGSRRLTSDPVDFLDRLAALTREEGSSLIRTITSLDRGGRGDAAVVITGAASDDDLRAVGGLCRRFRTVTLVSLRADARRRPTTPLAGVVTIDALTAIEAVGLWNRVVGR